jgi:uncharacterized membrane protein YeiH
MPATPAGSTLAAVSTTTILASTIDWGAWKLTGDLTTIDLIAASTNALNGALLCRRPDHFKNYTVVGVILMALLGGIGGGVTRDVLANEVPAALTNPAYIVLCVLFGVVGYQLAYAKGQLFREGLFQFMTSFSLPWYAIVGAAKGVDIGLPILGCVALGVVGPTAGRWLIDVSSNVSPKQFIQGEWFVTIAAATALLWYLLDAWGVDGWDGWLAYLIAFAFGFTVRLLALYRAWEEPLAKEPEGVYRHSDGRPMLGRKLSHSSVRELHDLGLLTPDQQKEMGA